MDGIRGHRVDPTIAGGVVIALIGCTMVLSAAFDRSAGATQPNPEHKVTLCHATASSSNPYTVIDVDVASVQFQGHDGHNGPIFFPEIPNDEQWGDIIPAFDYGDGMQYAGKNWPEGQTIVDAGCTLPTASTTTTSAEPVTTTTGQPGTTTSTTEAPATTTTTNSPGTTTTTTPPPTTTTTRTVPPTSTTAPNATTTTIPATTPPTSTVNTQGEHATTPPSTATSSGTRGLPFTGSGALPLAVGGVVLVAAGAALALGRRRQLAR